MSHLLGERRKLNLIKFRIDSREKMFEHAFPDAFGMQLSLKLYWNEKWREDIHRASKVRENILLKFFVHRTMGSLTVKVCRRMFSK